MTESSPDDFLASLNEELEGSPEDLTSADTAETQEDATEDEEPLFSEAELEELIDGRKEPEAEPFAFEKLQQLKVTTTTDAEMAAKVQVPKDEAEYEKVTEDLGLRLEEARAQRDRVPNDQPLRRRALDRQVMALGAEKAAVKTAYDLATEAKVMELYEASPEAKAAKERSEMIKNRAIREAEILEKKDAQRRQENAKTMARELRQSGIYRPK